MLALAWGTGCSGAKTGLYTPDADVGPDAFDAGPDAPCIELPLDGGPVDLDLVVEAIVGSADVSFLIDTTASMGDEIDRIRETLRDQIVPALEEAIPDSRLAVATFADFPDFGHGVMSAGDRPYQLRIPMTTDIASVQAALETISLGDGADIAESQVEALFQTATGAGRGRWVPPSTGCPSGGFGYPCFRRTAMPVVLLFTDAEFHNGPEGENPYSDLISPPPASYEQAVRALNAGGIRVIGFNSGGSDALSHLRQVAEATGAVAAFDSPLVYDIGRTGQRLGVNVVEAIRTFASTVVQDVDAIVRDVDISDDIDPTIFIEQVRPTFADPADGVERIDLEGGVFVGARAGTRLHWQLIVVPGAVVPGTEPRRFQIEVVFRGDGVRPIGREIVDIVIPAADGRGCDFVGE